MSDERTGQYRYVRGRSVDPRSGRPEGEEEIPVAEVVTEPLAPRPRFVSSSPVQRLEDTPWADAPPPRRRSRFQKLLWTGGGAIAAVVGMVVLGAQGPKPAEEAVVRSETPAALAPQRGVVAAEAVKRVEPAVLARTQAEPSPAGSEGESATASEATGEPASPAPPAAPAPLPVEVATVKIAINATPWALIEIDGQPVGETPLAGVELAVGRHRFVARMPDGSVRERVAHVDALSGAVLFE
jgi:hypothetical protein